MYYQVYGEYFIPAGSVIIDNAWYVHFCMINTRADVHL